MDKDDLKQVFKMARERNAPYIFIEVSIPGCDAGEMIINKREILISKRISM